MWTLILMTLVFSGSVAGGVAVNTAFLDFPNGGKCRSAASAMEAAERIAIGEAAPDARAFRLLPTIALSPDALSAKAAALRVNQWTSP